MKVDYRNVAWLTDFAFLRLAYTRTRGCEQSAEGVCGRAGDEHHGLGNQNLDARLHFLFSCIDIIHYHNVNFYPADLQRSLIVPRRSLLGWRTFLGYTYPILLDGKAAIEML